MREIVFRGKRAKDGKWVDGSLFSSMTGQKFIRWEVEDDGAIEEIVQYEVNPETIGQFTGLTDKNGKRVFEGDIVCADTGRRWFNGICTDYTQYVVVVYNSQKARFEILGKLGESHKALDQVIDKCSATVVGNIHDKPELLEVK